MNILGTGSRQNIIPPGMKENTHHMYACWHVCMYVLNVCNVCEVCNVVNYCVCM